MSFSNNIASSSDEAIGWMAAGAAMLAFGSFGVPIKSEAANAVDVDPLVFQTYKSGVCFATSWLVLLSADVSFSFTPWGVVSCLFWVPGGVATVFAIRNAGLALAMGIGSSTIVLVSFVWGIFVFEEPIHSRLEATLAIALMMAGLAGMAVYSSPSTSSTSGSGGSDGGERMDHSNINNTEFVSMTSQDEEGEGIMLPLQRHHQQHQQLASEGDPTDTVTTQITQGVDETQAALHSTARTDLCDSLNSAPCANDTFADEHDNPLRHRPQEQPHQFQEHPHQQQQQQRPRGGAHDPLEVLYVCGIPFTRRQLGMAGAIFNGVWGGSIMVPMKFAKDTTSANTISTKGVHYLISFGIGAAVVTTALWVVRWANNVVYYQGNLPKAYQALPSFHWKVMWCAGGTSGLLWSIGNFFSLLSVYYLGEGVGYSVVQAGMLVSGLFGIFLFHEIRGTETIAKWFASACVTICGIILLSYEHHKK